MRGSGAAASGVAGALVAAALLFGGGSSDTRLFWLASAAVIAAGALGAGALLAAVPRPRLGGAAAAAVALFGAFVLWMGLSVLWSVEPDRSWDYVNRGVAYLALLVLGVFVGTLVRRAPRLAAAALAALIAAALLWALAGKVIPALFPDGARRARLRSPVGYWNALAVLGATALPLALWVLARARARLRVAGVLLVYVAVVAILLTYSRSGALVAALGAAAWLALVRERLAPLAALAIGGLAGAAVAGIGFALPGIAEDGQAHATRVRDGALFGLALGAGALAVVAVSLYAERYEARLSPERRRRLVRQTILAGAGVAAVVLIGLVVRAGGPVDWVDARIDEFNNPATVQAPDQPERFQSTSSNNRSTWWREAATAFSERPLVGSGAGSFEVAHRRLRHSELEVREPHSLPLQLLSETGLIGFALGFGAIAAAALAIMRALRRFDEPDRLAGTALAFGPALYVLHGLVDIDWDFVAVSAPVFCVAGILLGFGAARPAVAPRREPLWALGVAALGAACLYSLAAPWLADRRVDDAYAAIDRGLTTGDAGELRRAADRADRAHALNPVSIEPLLAGAAAAEARGDDRAALGLYRQATDVQPESRSAWFELGRFEFRVLMDVESAYVHLNRVYALDSFYRPGNVLLTEVRCKRDPADCPPGAGA